MDDNPQAASLAPRNLSRTLRLVGLGKLVLGILTLILAFTGYDTPRAVNGSFALIGINLLVLGWLSLAVSQSFARASGDPVSPLQAEALSHANRLFGYYLVLLSLAVLGVGFDTVMFLIKIMTRAE
jgi:hypothetical protein